MATAPVVVPTSRWGVAGLMKGVGQAFRLAMTPVSRSLGIAGVAAVLSRLAWRSHALPFMHLVLPLLALGGQSGCLLSPPPEYEEDPEIPPVLDVLNAIPPTTQVHERSSGDQMAFTVGILEGQNRALWAFLVRDYLADSEDLVDIQTIYPERNDPNITFSASLTGDDCYQYTIFVTHVGNGDPPGKVEDESDVALVTWWVNVEDDDQPNLVRDCPTRGVQ